MARPDLNEYFSKKNLDVRAHNNGRWIDQKCTADVVRTISEVVVTHTDDDRSLIFSSPQLRLDDAARATIQRLFRKPPVGDDYSDNEYDKFFQQPLELLSQAGVITKSVSGRKNYYSIAELSLLEWISWSDHNALEFLITYIEKTLADTELLDVFEEFFEDPTSENFYQVKETFQDAILRHTPINGCTEISRIFTKVINPLAFDRHTLGTRRGFLSKTPITPDELLYNRINFRDEASGKSKNITRAEYEPDAKDRKKRRERQLLESKTQKNRYKRFIDDEFNSASEYPFDNIDEEIASHVHHIFPESDFPEIASFWENLIALTPNQHLNRAHPKGSTTRVCPEYQRKLLLRRLDQIHESMQQGHSNYALHSHLSLNKFLNVLSIGLNDDGFLTEEYGFESTRDRILSHYSKP